MPREVLVEFVGPEEISGKVPGTKSLVYGLDADAYEKLGIAKIVDEHPAPRSWLLDDQGNVPEGVLAGSQVKQSPEQRESEKQYLRDQVKVLDAKHEAEAAKEKLKAAIQQRRKETSRG